MPWVTSLLYLYKTRPGRVRKTAKERRRQKLVCTRSVWEYSSADKESRKNS
jgi:hypothetical protein